MFRSQDPLGLNPNDAFNFLDDQVYLMSKGAPTSLPAGKVAVEVRTQLVQLDPLPAKITINEAKKVILEHYKNTKSVGALPLITLVAEVCQAANHPSVLALRKQFIDEMADELYHMANARAQQQGGWVRLCSQEIQQAQDNRVRLKENARRRREDLRKERESREVLQSPLYAFLSSLSGIFSGSKESGSSHYYPSSASLRSAPSPTRGEGTV